MSPVLHGRAFFTAVGIAILGAVTIAAVISIKHPDRRTKPQAAIKQHIAKEMSEMKAAADAAAGDSQGASGPHMRTLPRQSRPAPPLWRDPPLAPVSGGQLPQTLRRSLRLQLLPPLLTETGPTTGSSNTNGP